MSSPRQPPRQTAAGGSAYSAPSQARPKLRARDRAAAARFVLREDRPSAAPDVGECQELESANLTPRWGGRQGRDELEEAAQDLSDGGEVPWKDRWVRHGWNVAITPLPNECLSGHGFLPQVLGIQDLLANGTWVRRLEVGDVGRYAVHDPTSSCLGVGAGQQGQREGPLSDLPAHQPARMVVGAQHHNVAGFELSGGPLILNPNS